MLDTATKFLSELKIDATFKITKDSTLPFADNTFDFISSNGVFNLCIDKQSLYKEIYRVLKPSGKLAFADICTKEKTGAKEIDAKSWSN